MNTENLSTLVIHKLTQDQYNRVVEEGEIDENALYLTPDEITDAPKPDWNQNDETALDYIKNRTHWEEAIETVIFEETIPGWDYDRGVLLAEYVVPQRIPGEKYRVVFNGIEYNCIANEIGTLGNLSLDHEEDTDTGEPFMIGDSVILATMEALPNGGAADIKISLILNSIHHLDPKYLPDNIQSDWNQNNETAIDYIKNRPFYEGDITKTTLVEETTISSWMEYDGVIYTTKDIGFVPKEGKEYYVTWDGVEYTCVAYTGSYGNSAIGNDALGAGSNNTNEQFYIDEDQIIAATNENHTFSIEETITPIIQIDKKYLPALVGEFTEGKTYIIDSEEIVAQNGAEIFNDYEYNIASGLYSHAEGNGTLASGNYSHAEGEGTVASDRGAHAEGSGAIASNRGAHAEGSGTASGEYSHAEGEMTTASKIASHAEGYSTTASGNHSHAEGWGSIASGASSHAEGYYTTASGLYSHSEGRGTIASGEYSHAEGKYNIQDEDDVYAHIVGNGSQSVKSNAHTLDWEGNAWFSGDVYVGSTSGTNKDEGSVKLQKEIIGTPGQFVVIDDNGNVTTKNIKEMVFTVSIPLNWEIDTVNGGYFQTVYVDGILEEDNPTVDIVLGYDVNTNTSQLQSYGCITKIITAKNYITLYADNNIPTSEFTIKMKVVR